MGRNIIETVLGAVVLVVAAFFLTFALKTADVSKIQGYLVTANFPRADGLKNGSDVVVNGVKVGHVLGQDLITAPGKDQFLVKVTMMIDSRVQLPTDTVALIANESLLGGRYLSLEIGADDENIRTDGTGRIYHTQPPMRLDDLIGKLMFSSKDEKKDGGTKGSESNKDNDDFSYGTSTAAPPQGGMPGNQETDAKHPDVNAPYIGLEPRSHVVNPLEPKAEPKIVEPQKGIEPLKAEPIMQEEIRLDLPKESAAPAPIDVVKPALPEPGRKDDAARRRYDSRTWYELQRDKEANPAGTQRYVPSQDSTPLALPGRP